MVLFLSFFSIITSYYAIVFTVAVKKVVVEEHLHGIPHNFHSDTPSIASSYTGKSSATGRASSRGTARSNVSGHMATNLDTTGKIIELEDEGDEFGGLGATGHMFDMLQKSVSSYSKLVFCIIYL